MTQSEIVQKRLVFHDCGQGKFLVTMDAQAGEALPDELLGRLVVVLNYDQRLRGELARSVAGDDVLDSGEILDVLRRT